MVFQAPPTQYHEAQILTANFQLAGKVETVGETARFINDPDRQYLALDDARLAPLTPGSPLGGLSRPLIVVSRAEIIFLHFSSAEIRGSIRLLNREESLVVYTPIAVCRGTFHVTAEARVRDFVTAMPGHFLPITDAQIFPLIDFPAPFPTQIDLLLLGRSQVRTYHPD